LAVKVKKRTLKLLVGWTRIAKYLQCSVATAKRREREGLPVVRVGGAVCALPEDVDVWLGKRGKKKTRR
jgi:hypothetical protein